jgi:hypothetical protein
MEYIGRVDGEQILATEMSGPDSGREGIDGYIYIYIYIYMEGSDSSNRKITAG